MRTLDHNYATYGQGCELTRVVLTDGGHTIRVRIRRDSYKQQSHAVAEVLTPGLTWTTLAEQRASKWHDKTAHVDDQNGGAERVVPSEQELAGLAGSLIERAVRILTPVRPGAADEVVAAEASLIENLQWTRKHVGAAARHFLSDHADLATQRAYIAFLLREQVQDLTRP